VKSRVIAVVLLAVVLLVATAVLAAPPKTAVATSPAAMRAIAQEFYDWRDREDPVNSSDQGKHEFDSRLSDHSAAAVAARAAHVTKLLERVRAIDVSKWNRDDIVDWLLFRSQLERIHFGDRVLQSESTNPQGVVGEASNAIFSLLKKDYDTPHKRVLAATARLRAVPAMIEQAKRNLTAPVGLYARLAAESARAIDPLYNDSLMTLATGLPPAEKKDLIAAKDGALVALHGFADWLEKKMPSMKPWRPMGETEYNFYLSRVLLLPFPAHDVAHLGEVELARYRALEALLPDPSLADPDPKRAASIPPDQAAFLAAYQSREEEMVRFLKERRLITIPDYLGPFLIRQLPEAFKPTSPGGFMNPPGIYDPDASGFFFIPTYNPASRNFYIRAAIEDPRPILGHEGIPGHFLQLSIANHLTNEIRRQHGDNVFVEGWALYGEEMLMREGLYPQDSAAAAQVLRLSRYRAARIGVDVNLHTGRWTFPQAVSYFMEAGGLDKEAAEGEAAGAASDPTQKISYITGKWQIMRVLGKYRDAKGPSFRLGQFHDDLVKNGSLPLSIVEWLLLDDPGDVEKATGLKLH
jgi:uncharacterized protein (DUF885 family)